MTNGLLASLPPPPPGRTGWPWTEESPTLPAEAAPGVPWPRIVVVTPSFRQGHFIEETIRSILLQNYPNVEYYVMDGGSQDSTVEVLRRYEHWLTGWVSEKDRGQTHAINKGFARSSGQGVIHAYINSDDYYQPGAFEKAARAFLADPGLGILHGRCRYIAEDGTPTGTDHQGQLESFAQVLNVWEFWWRRKQFIQPEVFWNGDLHRRVGDFREELYYVMDYDFWLRLFRAGATVRRIEDQLATFRLLATQKSAQKEKLSNEMMTKVIGPALATADGLIPPGDLRRIRARFRYHEFLALAAQSVASGEGRMRRYWRLLRHLSRHPGMLQVPSCRHRLAAIVTGRFEGGSRA